MPKLAQILQKVKRFEAGMCIGLFLFWSLYLTNRFHFAVRLFSHRSQMTSKCRKNKEEAHEPQASVSLLFLPHFDVLCDLLLNRPKAPWNLFVFYTITEILRALWLADACYLLEDRCTNDVTAWRDPRAWSKFIAVSRAGKDFQNSGPKQSEKYSALFEDFSEKETAEYQSQWEPFNSAKHAKSLPAKNYQKLLESYVVEKFADAAENPRMLMNGSDWTLSVVAYWVG